MRSYSALYISDKTEIFNEIPDMNDGFRDFCFSLIPYGLRSYVDYFPETESLIFVHRVNLKALREPRTDFGLLINKIQGVSAYKLARAISHLVEIHAKSVEDATIKARKKGFLIAENNEIDCPWEGYVEKLLSALRIVEKNLISYIVNEFTNPDKGKSVAVRLPLLNEYEYVGLACRLYYLSFFVEVMYYSSLGITSKYQNSGKIGENEFLFVPVVYSIRASKKGLRFIWFANSGKPLKDIVSWR